MTIGDTTISNAAVDGIEFANNNSNVTITRTTITDVGSNGINIQSNNSVILDDSIFAGTFGANGLFIDGAGNTVNGVGNTAAAATFGGNLCEDGGNAWTGTVVFDGVAITSANCP